MEYVILPKMLSHSINANLRDMTIDDLAEVMQIERASYSHPWTERMFRDCWQSRYFSYILELSHAVIGYAIIMAHKEEAHILNICIKAPSRRAGWGEWFLLELLSSMHKKKVQSVFLEVRESNWPAINLYKKCGFNEISIRKDYYPAECGREAALIFAKELLADFQEQ